MQSSIQLDLAGKIGQTVLQTRIHVKRALFTHIQDTLKALHQPSTAHPSLPVFLHKLIPDDTYRIRQKLAKHYKQHNQDHSICLQIVFILVERVTSVRATVQSWLFTVKCHQNQAKEHPIMMVAEFFSEVTLILNKLPLLSVYHKDRSLKNRYFLQHQITIIENQKTQRRHFSLSDLRGQHFLKRRNKFYSLSAQVAYTPCLTYLNPKHKINTEEDYKTSRKSSSDMISEGEEDRVSVYAFYDPDLDLTFLTSDEQNLKKPQGAQEIKLEVDNESCDDQFELLISNEDEDFLNENKDVLQVIINLEPAYIQLK